METYYLIFRVGQEGFAFSGEQVREIVARPALASPPGLPDILAGFINLGGQNFPVLDLPYLFKQQSRLDLEQHIILLRDHPMACLVDRVLDFCPLSDLRALPEGHLFNAWAKDLSTYQNQEIVLLEAPALLLHEEKIRLESFQKQTQIRLQAWEC